MSEPTRNPDEIKVTTKGRWVIDTYRAALKAGKTREEAVREVNRLLFPDASAD